MVTTNQESNARSTKPKRRGLGQILRTLLSRNRPVSPGPSDDSPPALRLILSCDPKSEEFPGLFRSLLSPEGELNAILALPAKDARLFIEIVDRVCSSLERPLTLIYHWLRRRCGKQNWKSIFGKSLSVSLKGCVAGLDAFLNRICYPASSIFRPRLTLPVPSPMFGWGYLKARPLRSRP